MNPQDHALIIQKIAGLWPTVKMTSDQVDALMGAVAHFHPALVLRGILAHKMASGYATDIGGIVNQCRAIANEDAARGKTQAELDREDWAPYWRSRLAIIERAVEAMDEEERRQFALMVRDACSARSERQRAEPGYREGTKTEGEMTWEWLCGVKARAKARLAGKAPAPDTATGKLEQMEAEEDRDAVLQRDPWRSYRWLAALEPHLVRGDVIAPRPSRWMAA